MREPEQETVAGNHPPLAAGGAHGASPGREQVLTSTMEDPAR